MMAEPTIFVAIAAYRDMEIYPTVQDIFAQAKHPEKLHVAVCWQYDTTNQEPLDFKQYRDQVSIVNIDHRKSRGVCWIRHLLQKLYCNETYFLMIDAHSRFIPNWDEEMIAELARCPSEKPILSTYCDGYELPSKICGGGPYKLGAGVLHDDVPNMCAVYLREEDKLFPCLSAFISGHFLFTHGRAITEVPWDPLVYFIGEEISMAARYWTHGYDMFAPTKVLMCHLYPVAHPNKSIHWDDHPDWYFSYQLRSAARVKHLLGIAPSEDPWVLERIELYGLGTVRTLAEYEAFAGINFKESHYSENAKQGIATPRTS